MKQGGNWSDLGFFSVQDEHFASSSISQGNSGGFGESYVKGCKVWHLEIKEKACNMLPDVFRLKGLTLKCSAHGVS